MIRTAYIVPSVRQFRLRLELVTRRTRRTLVERCRALRTRSAHPPAAPIEPAAESYVAYLQRREAFLQSRATYQSFEVQLDRLIGVLCIAAQEGITVDREMEYRDCRDWFLQHYGAVKRYLTPFLMMDESDTVVGLWGTRPCDAFEALFMPLSLAVMLETDNGYLINRLMRAQNAATEWEASLCKQGETLL